jgi:uncharacterized membrane protein
MTDSTPAIPPLSKLQQIAIKTAFIAGWPLVIAVVLTIVLGSLLIVWPMLFLAKFKRSEPTGFGLTAELPWSSSDD